MTSERQLRTAALFAGAIVAGLAWGGSADASVAMKPRAEPRCLESRTALKPENGKAVAGGKVALRNVKVCTIARRACMAHGQEVPGSLCLPSG